MPLSRCTWYIVTGRALDICQGGPTHFAAFWHCMWGKSQRGNNDACLALAPLSVTSPTTHRQIGPFWCWFQGEWVCVYSRTPWALPTDFPVRLGVSLTITIPTGFYSQRFWGFSFSCYNPGLWGMTHSPVFPPGLTARECGTTGHCITLLVLQLPPCCVSSLPWLPVSTLPTSLNECFFFNSLVVGHPYSLIFWQF